MKDERKNKDFVHVCSNCSFDLTTKPKMIKTCIDLSLDTVLTNFEMNSSIEITNIDPAIFLFNLLAKEKSKK